MNNKPGWLVEREVTVDNQKVTYSYDEEGDVLEIVFEKGGGVGIDLTENITLRYDRDSKSPLSLILTSYSLLIRPTPFGPPSFRLTALSELPFGMRQVILEMLNTSPVNLFLKVSGLQLTPGGELQPIAYLVEQPTDLPFEKTPA